MRNLSLLFILFVKPSAAPCPVACDCGPVNHDSSSGQTVNCNRLFKDELPGNAKLNSDTTFELHFRYNSLRGFPNRLKNFTQLRILDLSKNRLLKLNNDTFRLLGNLKKLNLSGNYVREIGVSAFIGLHRLQLLDLSRNELKVVPSEVLQFWTEENSDHRKACLDRNRWVCNCSLVGFMRWYISHVESGFIESCDGNPPVECDAPQHLSSRGFDSSTVGEILMCEVLPATTNQQVTTTLTTQPDPSTTLLTTTDYVTTSMSTRRNIVTLQATHDAQLAVVSVSSANPFTTTSKTSDNTKFWVLDGELVMYVAVIAIFVIFVLLLVFAAVLCKMARRQRILETVTTSDSVKLTTKDVTSKSLHHQGKPALPPRPLHYNSRISGDYADIPASIKFNDTCEGYNDIPQIDPRPNGTYTWEIKPAERSSWEQHSSRDLRIAARKKNGDSPPSREKSRPDAFGYDSTMYNTYESISMNNSEYQSSIYKH